MKGRSSSRVNSAAAAAAAAVTTTVISSTPSIITAPASSAANTAAPATSNNTTTNQQTDQNPTNVENGRAEAATPAQMSPQVITQPSTPRTPTSPTEQHTPNPPTPGTTNSNNSTNLVDASPHYVTITDEGQHASSRTYASLASVSSAVDGETVTAEAVPENAAYVTYVEGSTADHTLYAAAAAAAAAASANGQSMSYPVYTVGDTTTTAIYSPGGSGTQYYTTSASTPAVAYTQESGVTYLVPSTSNNSISLEAADGQHNISHATRVSPATSSSVMRQRNNTAKSTLITSPQKSQIQHINYPPAKIRRIESFSSSSHLKLRQHQQQQQQQFQEDDEEEDDDQSFPIPPPVMVTMESSSGESDMEDSSEDDKGRGTGGDVRVNQFESRRIKRIIATAGSGRTSLERISGESNHSSSVINRRLKDLDVIPLAGQMQAEYGGAAINGISTIAKFCPATVQWLLENYETAEGVSLPRSTLYYHYLRHCNEHKLDPVNAASFGKLIRSVFLGLRTRRLGTRGNSKYHYYGIRLKPNSPLVNIAENGDGQGLSQTSSAQSSPNPSSGGTGTGGSQSGGEGVHVDSRGCNVTASSGAANGVAKRLKISKGEHYDISHGGSVNIGDPFVIQQFLGDPSGALDNLPELDLKINVPDGLSMDDVIIFRTLYREHCESLLDCLANFQLSQVESYWKNFWRNATHPDNAEMEYEKLLSKPKLVLLCTVKEVQDYIRETDFQFYQNIVGILVPDVLRPIPSAMTQAIRNFAKTLDSWMSAAIAGYPAEIVTLKLSGANALAQTLRRYTSLNHLAQAARAVLQNQNQIAQMLTDLNRVDFHNVEEQASWVCGCMGDMVPNLEQDFKATLAQQQTLEQWASWLEGVVDRILRPHLSSSRFVQAARQFLLKWSFYSSLVIRDLTLRSAASFGSFHLLRLLYDEYMFYLVEHRVAQVTGIVPIAVIGKKSIEGMNLGHSSSHSGDEDLLFSGESPTGRQKMASFAVIDGRRASIGSNGERHVVNGSEGSGSPYDMSSTGGNLCGDRVNTSATISPNATSVVTVATTPRTTVTSTANVNVHQITPHTGVVVKPEMKRVKNFLTV